jgi:hypothetical protein
MTTEQPHPHRRPDLRHPQIAGSAQPNPAAGTGAAGFASARPAARDSKHAESAEPRHSALSQRFAAQPPINSTAICIIPWSA